MTVRIDTDLMKLVIGVTKAFKHPAIKDNDFYYVDKIPVFIAGTYHLVGHIVYDEDFGYQLLELVEGGLDD